MKLAETEPYRRIGKEPREAEKIFGAENVIAAAAAILTSGATFAGTMAPLGIAWYSANMKNDKYYLVLLGTVLGSLLQGGAAGTKYILAAVFLLLLRKMIHTAVWEKPVFCSITAAGTVLGCSVLLMLWKGFLYYDLIMAMLEAVIVCGAGMIFARAKTVFSRGGYVTCDDESIAIAILAGAAVAGLQGISFLGVSPANILSLYLILIAGYKNGMGISGAVGAALGMIVGAAEQDIAVMTGIYAFIGIAVGAMRSLGPLGVAVGAAFANAGFAVWYHGAGSVWIPMTEAVAASACFYFTPPALFDVYEKILVTDAAGLSEGTQVMFYRKKTNEAMNQMKRALGVMSGILRETAEETENGREEMMGAICERLAGKVCNGCSIYHYCWGKNPKATYRLFAAMTEAMTRQNADMDMMWHKIVQDKCIKSEELLQAAKQLYTVYRNEMMQHKKNREQRQMMAQQLACVSDMLENRQALLGSIGKRERELETELYKNLYRRGVTAKGVNVMMRGEQYTAVLEVNAEAAEADLEPVVSSVLERTMRLCESEEEKESIWLEFRERTVLQYETAVVKVDRKNGIVSGDSSGKFVTENGELHCILSDGMGSGTRAAQESKTVVKLYEQLVCAGYEPTAALRTVNASLMCAKENESCTTADVVCADLNSGTVRFIKAGAAASIVKTETETKVMRWGSMPLGILPMEEIECRCEQAETPIYIAMMTDGIPDNIGDRIAGENYLSGILKSKEEKSCKQIADEMVVAALAKGLPKDDMTAMVVKLF